MGEFLLSIVWGNFILWNLKEDSCNVPFYFIHQTNLFICVHVNWSGRECESKVQSLSPRMTSSGSYGLFLYFYLWILFSKFWNNYMFNPCYFLKHVMWCNCRSLGDCVTIYWHALYKHGVTASHFLLHLPWTHSCGTILSQNSISCQLWGLWQWCDGWTFCNILNSKAFLRVKEPTRWQ